jgi:hypothetical protein
VFYNAAWREFQRDLAQSGDPAQTEEVLISSLPVVANIDPYTQVYLGQANYFDGQNYYTTPTVNLLPQNVIIPLHVQERLGGTTQIFSPMAQCDNGLPGAPKTPCMRYWEWRSAGPGNGNAIFMPGATTKRDLWIRSATYLPDAVTVGPTFWYLQKIPILRCADILGFYVAAKFALSRGSEQAVAIGNSFLEQGKAAMRAYLNSTTMKIRQRVNHRRRPYAANRHNGWAFW